jgi:indolepyruvate decarboxylase
MTGILPISRPRSAAGERVTTRRGLAAALDRAVKRRGQFSLVEMMLPRGATSGTLARFVSGFKSVRELMATGTET